MEPIVDLYIPVRGPVGAEIIGRHYSPTVTGASWGEDQRGCTRAEFTVSDAHVVADMREDCPVILSDPASGEVLWTGNIATGGIQRSALGSSALVRCTGNVDWLYRSFWSLPYLVVEDYSQWEMETIKYNSGANWKVSTGARPTPPPWDAVTISIPQGSKLYPGDGGRAQYVGHLASDMYLGGLACNIDHGINTNPDGSTPRTMRTEIYVGDQFWGKRPYRATWTSTSEDLRLVAGVSAGWPAPPSPVTSPPRDNQDNYLVIRTLNEATAGVEVTEAESWAAASLITVTGQRVNEHGQNVYPPADGSMLKVDAPAIIRDLVGRCLRGVIDPALLTIEHDSTWSLENADYRDPTSPGEILEDLEAFHSDHFWRVTRTSPTSGQAGLTWRKWDLTPRYIVDVTRAEVDMDAGTSELYNRVTVNWTHWKKRGQSRTFIADPVTYPDIASLQGAREPEPIALDESLGQNANVNRVGSMWLAQVATARPAGTVTITEPVYDTVSRTLVPPHLVEAGTTLALSSDEPTRTYRVIEVEHDGLDVATLSVGSRHRTLAHVLSARGKRRI